VPFDAARGVLPNDGGRILAADGTPLPGLYATGWIKRGPVGLTGHTKGDALETVTRLVEDLALLPEPGPDAAGDADAILHLLGERGIRYTTWSGWLALDAHERALGDADESAVLRERVKVVSRDEQVAIASATVLVTT
jgi:ferredoxin--NADP+ reductase